MDNLFVVQSPLQALIAVELCLQFPNEKNGIIYRLSGTGRERNDEQIEKVVSRGHWDFMQAISFGNGVGLSRQLNVRKNVLQIKKQFSGKVRRLFFGDFRSQWMHIVRSVILPEKAILIDDGASTLTVKKNYIDKLIFYPETIWRNESILKYFLKKIIHAGLIDKKKLNRPIFIASAYLKQDSLFKVDFSSLRENTPGKGALEAGMRNNVYFFGSKYSEASIISRKYELDFIGRVKNFYKNENLRFIYCAHRDECDDKLKYIRDELNIEVKLPNLPAELFMVDNVDSIYELSAAYSSVVNNFNLLFPDKKIRSFVLDANEINPKYRENIIDVYKYFESQGITIENDF